MFEIVPESVRVYTTEMSYYLKGHRRHLRNSVSIRYFVGEVLKLYFNEEVEVRGYLGIVCSIRLIGLRLLAEAQNSLVWVVFVL